MIIIQFVNGSKINFKPAQENVTAEIAVTGGQSSFQFYSTIRYGRCSIKSEKSVT